jgi:hypothetical protein
MKSNTLAVAIVMALAQPMHALAAPNTEQLWETIQVQQKEIEELKKEQEKTKKSLAEADQKIEATADSLESQAATGSKSLEWASKTKIGGYGEHHYNNFNNSDDEIDAHRFVLFISHEFQKNVRFFSEFELEHSLAGEGKPGEVELEQAYVEWDYAANHKLVSGLFLLPVGILNETHEPNTFYGVERNKIENSIIPTTWWETGVMLRGEFAPGLSYNFALHSGLESTEINIRSGRQKSAEAIANDWAYTGRIKYTGIPGLEVAASLQYQEDISQGLLNDVGPDNGAAAQLVEVHTIYDVGRFAFRALYAQWDVDGTTAESLGRDKQKGWYAEPSYKLLENFGVFARLSRWDNTAGLSSSSDMRVVDYGFNYWLTPEVVFKADYQDASDFDDNDSVNLGVGWSF